MKIKTDDFYSSITAGKLLGINHKTIGSWIDRGLLKPAKFEKIRNGRQAARLDKINMLEIYLMNLLSKYGLSLRFVADTVIKDFREQGYADMENKLQFKFAGKPSNEEVIIEIDPAGELPIRIFSENKNIIEGVKSKEATLFINYLVVNKIITEKIERYKKWQT